MKAALAAMFSDSSKAGWDKGSGGNFFTHHLDGALASGVVLDRYRQEHPESGLTAQDVKDVQRINLEHQIAPCDFMPGVYTDEARRQMTLERAARYVELRQRSQRPLKSDEQDELSSLQKLKDQYEARQSEFAELERTRQTAGAPGTQAQASRYNELKERLAEGPWLSDKESSDLKTMNQMMSAPFSSATEPDEHGGKRLKFTTDQRELFRKYVGAGTENWYVPEQPSKIDSNSSEVARAAAVMLQADNDNYFPRADAEGDAIKGPNKIAAVRGPISSQPDSTIDSAIQAIKHHAENAFSQGLITPGSTEKFRQRMENADQVYEQAKARVSTWLHQRLEPEPGSHSANGESRSFGKPALQPGSQEIPYWNAPLENMPPPGAPQEEYHAFLARPEVQLAHEIHQRFVSELEKMRRPDQSVQTDLRSVRGMTETELEARAAQAEATVNETAGGKTSARQQLPGQEPIQQWAQELADGDRRSSDLHQLGLAAQDNSGLKAVTAETVQDQMIAKLTERQMAGHLTEDARDANVLREALGLKESDLKRLSSTDKLILAEDLRGRLMAAGIAADLAPALTRQVFQLF